MLQIFPRDDRSLEGQWGSYWVSGVSKPEANGLPTPFPRGSLDPHPLLWSHYPACLSLWQCPTGLCLLGQQGKSACIPVLALGIPVGKGLLGLSLWVDLKEACARGFCEMEVEPSVVTWMPLPGFPGSSKLRL